MPKMPPEHIERPRFYSINSPEFISITMGAAYPGEKAF
jgi:hypothetical protein